MSGWTLVDGNNNKSLPWTGTNNTAYITPGTQTQDPVGKFRVSQPQALIDTDFEYGTQPTKWESISLQNNRQSVYYIPQQPLNVTSITGTTTLTITVAAAITIAAGTPIYIQNATDPNANGWWYTDTGVTTGTTFTIIPTSACAAGEKFSATSTYVYSGYFYSNCGIAVGSNAFVTSTNTVTVTTSNPHGLSVNSLIYVKGLGGSPTAVMGAFIVATVPTANTFTYTSTGAAGTPTNAAGNTFLYARPAGYVEPRAFDGGVAFSAGAAVPNQQLIRQTRRYFRYQSGKGIQFSTGSSLKPTLFVTSVTSATSTVTVNTRYAHSLAVGTVIQVSGVDQAAFNGQWTIASVPTPNSLTYSVSPTVLGTVTATGAQIRVNPISWYGSSNRLGFFDQQNGLFFEYDGQTLYAVWRSSTTQINGSVSVTQGSSAVTGTGTAFSNQLSPGDFIVIRGQSYKVITIASDTSMFISPEYRGSTIANAVVSKTIDTKVPQSAWSDPLDGTGSSGYTLDLTKMQMFYIDYSWYGAGFIRWGFRTSKGQITYVYQQTNNNQRFEAYMRSGNMAAHYESSGLAPITTLTATLSSATTTSMSVGSTALLPSAGTVKVSTATSTGAIELISYTGKTATTLTGLTRGVTGGSAATTFTYSAAAPISVEYALNDTAAALSHWGSSVIMDGQFNDDKSLIFNYGTTTQLQLASSTTQVTPIIAIRIAPSVDNGITGLLGAKEIINRMQLQLVELGVQTDLPVLITLILNGYVTGGTWTAFTSPISGSGTSSAYTSSLAQVAVNSLNTGTCTGGESVAAAFTNTNGQTTLDLSQVRDLGNSILGGGTSNTLPTSYAGVYPDGPDILYVCATNVVGSATPKILARLSWKEAQA
jgi:hypothetical protein